MNPEQLKIITRFESNKANKLFHKRKVYLSSFLTDAEKSLFAYHQIMYILQKSRIRPRANVSNSPIQRHRSSFAHTMTERMEAIHAAKVMASLKYIP